MSTPHDWIDEANRRLDDARFLLDERARPGRSVSLAYYAVHAAGKGALLSVAVDIRTHRALYVQLGLHFVKSGALPDDTAAFIQDLHQERLAVDYQLKSHAVEEARDALDDAEALIVRLGALAS